MLDGIYMVREGSELVRMSCEPYEDEPELQRLLADFPRLLAGPGGSDTPWLLVRREPGIPSEEGGSDRWALDHLFLDWIAQLDDPHLFHWHNYENWRLKRMGRRYGRMAEVEMLLSERTTDLHRVATGAFVFPTYSNSIKNVAPYMGFEWRHDDVSATESIAMYFEYLNDPDGNASLLEKIVEYNRDDCVATAVAKDWLAEEWD